MTREKNVCRRYKTGAGKGKLNEAGERMEEEIKTLSYEWELGREELAVKVDCYAYGGLYIGLYQKEGESWEPFADLTVNLPGYSLEPDEAFITDFGSKDKLAFIKQHKLGKLLSETGRSGRCEYALVAFDLERLEKFDREGVSEYRRAMGLEQSTISQEKQNSGRDKSAGAERCR